MLRPKHSQITVGSQYGVLADVEPTTDDRWESEGFPLVGQRGDEWVPIPMKGAVYSLGHQSKLFQLDVDDPPTTPQGWQGASGSPVFVNGSIVGVIVVCPDDFGNGRLEAVPVCRLLEQRDNGFEATIGLTEDQQRKLLVGAAVDLLATSVEALAGLAGRLGVPDPRDPNRWSQTVVDKFMAGNSPPQILNALVRTQIELDRQQLNSAADLIERVAYYLVPAALTDAHVKQITVIANSGSQKFEFQAQTKTFVEIAVARVNGRETMFRSVASQVDNPSGRLCLAQPAEEGMDQNHDKFISSFVAELSQIIGSDLLGRDEPQTVRAINAELDAQFEVEGWQYYYVFENPNHEAERRKRRELATRLDQMFSRIAFIALDRAEGSQEELDTVSRMMRILCRAAGIEFKPHGTT